MNTAEITADDLIALVHSYNPKTNEKLIRAAFKYGAEMHDGQFRHSGEPYFTHPVAVAAILTEQQLDDATIITALLHDTIEDTDASYTMVEKQFGHEVAELVDGVTKLTIFADNDANFAGQSAAYTLANKLTLSNPKVSIVVHVPEKENTDWLDVLYGVTYGSV